MPEAQAIQNEGYNPDDHSLADVQGQPDGQSPTGDQPPAGQPPESPPAGVTPADWKAMLGNDPSVERFNSPEDYVKSFNEAQGMIRSSIRIPSEQASKEDMDQFYEKLTKIKGVYRQPNQDDPDSIAAYNAMRGVPATPDDYKFEAVDGYTPTEGEEAVFASIAHAQELTPKQANAMRQFIGGKMTSIAEKTQAEVDAGINGLKKEWGLAFEQNREAGIRGANFMNQQIDGFKEWIDGGAGNEPMVIRMMTKVAEMIGEDQMADVTGGGSVAMSPAEARGEINDIRNNKAHPFHNELDPSHQDALDRMQLLYNFATSGT